MPLGLKVCFSNRKLENYSSPDHVLLLRQLHSGFCCTGLLVCVCTVSDFRVDILRPWNAPAPLLHSKLHMSASKKTAITKMTN